MAISVDAGTMNLVKAEEDDLVNGITFTLERNAFLQASTSEDTETTLKENNWSYVKHEDKYYILGEDAFKLKNLLTVGSRPENQGIIATQIGELRRPMQNGVLNTGEEKLSIAIIQKLIEKLAGKPRKPGEVLCFCAPSDPVNSNLSVLFHKSILTSFFKSLGWEVECIPEALAIIYSERPVAEDPNSDEKEAPYSGIGISFGSGMINIMFAFKKIPLISFSVTKSGDHIDQEAAKVCGLNVSAITRYKETKFNLDKIDPSNMKDAALEIFYNNMIDNTLSLFAEKFNQLENPIDVPLEIVVAGGTSMVPGFLNKFNAVLKGKSLPFKVKGVRAAENPLYSVAKGCLIKAMSVEGKKIKEESKK